MTSSQQDTVTVHQDNRLWRFIALSDYDPPNEPAGETVRNTLHNLWERLYVRTHEDNVQDELEQDTLHAVPSGLLEWIAPAPTWEEHCIEAVDKALYTWLETDHDQAGIQLFVAPPYSNISEITINWSRVHEYAIIKPPTPTQILTNDPDWMKQWQQNKASRLVLPYLERCYLRHHNGLDLLRRLLDWLLATKTPCILVSDSWAWHYLKQIHGLDSLVARPLTLAALDATALNFWFTQLARRNGQELFNFRRSDNGQQVLSPTAQQVPDIYRTEGQQAGEQSHFLRHLAARSRGIPGVAWAIWRYSLQIRAGAEVEQKVKEQTTTDQGVSIWVTPWDKLELPDIPTTISTDESFVLHALLLHNGVPEEILIQLLPIASVRVLRALHHLTTHQLVVRGNVGRRVAPLAYPAVRAHLQNEGYLSDEL